MVDIPAGGEKRVDLARPGPSTRQCPVRVSAITDEESDAMEITFPAYVHGMLKTESFSAAMPADKSASLSFVVPKNACPSRAGLKFGIRPA